MKPPSLELNTSFRNLKPTEFLSIIDTQFNFHRKHKTSRLSVEWGTWSRKMNLEIRAVIDNEDTDRHHRMLLKYVFTYWIIRSQLLELCYKSSVLHYGKKKRLMDECQTIKGIITAEQKKPGSAGLPVDGTEKMFVEMVSDLMKEEKDGSN